jgi:hypothetical protein
VNPIADVSQRLQAVHRMADDDLDQIMETPEVCALARRKPRTIHNAVHRGKLRPLRRHACPLQFERREVIRWMRGEPIEAQEGGSDVPPTT